MLQDDFLSLFRGRGGRLGFTIERDKFVSDVLDYAAINGLQPGCRIVQVCLYVCVFVFVCIDPSVGFTLQQGGVYLFIQIVHRIG